MATVTHDIIRVGVIQPNAYNSFLSTELVWRGQCWQAATVAGRPNNPGLGQIAYNPRQQFGPEHRPYILQISAKSPRTFTLLPGHLHVNNGVFSGIKT
jgi:hypothetical protein